MTAADETFQRARRPEHKQQRRDAILAAARDLAARDGVRSVSLGDIARSVGLAKSNVVRYFGTREEIYLHLTAEGWREWSDDVRARLDGGPRGADEVAAALAEPLVSRPLFCDLLSHVSTNLEHNVSPEAARAFKLTTLGVLDELGTSVAAALGDLGPAAGVELVGVTVMAATAIWPVAHPPPVLDALYAEDPVLAAACITFAPTLERVVATFIAGLRATVA